MDASARLTRRGLLIGGAAGALALAVDPLRGQEASGAGAAAPDAAAAAPPPDRWQQLERLSGGEVVRPSHPRYAQEGLPNNLRFQHVRPEAIVPCRSPQMVADVLAWCQDYEVPFAIRGGGHSYAGFSASRSLIIDTSPMHALAYDAGSGRVRVEAGVLNAQVYNALRAGGRMMTHGRCPTVGVAGFLMGGGIGFNMRRLGMACDRLVEAEIVTADGRVLTLSATQNPDLFWAVRGGGGGNFGVCTAFTVETVPADERLTVFRMVWRTRTLEVAQALFAAADAAPETLGTRIALGAVTPALAAKGRQVPVTLLGQYAGSREALLALLAPVLAIAQPDFTDLRELGYWDGQEFLMEPGEPAYFHERSAFFGAAPDQPFLEQAFERLRAWPGTGAHADLFFFQTGGRINAVAPDATAFPHRASRWLGVVGISWSDDDQARPAIVRAAKAWQDGFYAALGPLGGGGAFVNFPDAALVDWRQRYYGSNLDRLARIKAAVDPTNLFTFPQAI